MPNLRFLFFLCLFVLLAFNAVFAGSFDMNKQCKEAYRAIMSLQLKEAKKLIASEKLSNPGNQITLLLENYADVITVFINEETEEFNRLEAYKNQRLAILSKSDKNSPYYLYSQAEINLQWALVRLKFEQYFKAFMEVQKAYKLLIENQQRFPDFYPNLKSLGAIHAFIGTIPDQYRWGVKLIGMEGNLKQGMNEIAIFLAQGLQKEQLFREEGLILQSFLLLYLDAKPEKAWEIVEELPKKNNLFNCFVAANIAMKTGRNEEAIHILQHKPTGAGYINFFYLDYLLGVCKLNRLDSDADIYLFSFTSNFKGSNYLKDAYQKIAWANLLKSKPEKYRQYMQYVKERGKALIDLDKQALKSAESNEVPDINLLKARLLFDGGYYQKALQTLQNFLLQSYSALPLQLEYTYRKARIFDGLKQYDNAIAFYSQTILLSKDSPYYFAPKSCLELGKLYEQSGNKQNAALYYRKAMEYKNHEYQNSIEQQAKAGLNRLKK
ncbi:MAG: tetratricopeptide repeat protein [Sphingobacteriales bacterium]|nr:MAG: tetratricopeptide repeat protein [Sphingobacteriales bacterium]